MPISPMHTPGVSATERELHDFLQQCCVLADMREQGYAYRNLYDFLLQHGAWFAPRALPRMMRRGAPRQCFGNAIITAAQQGLRYIEGYAMAIIPVHHAWCADAKGRMYEVTWEKPGLAYIGTEFSLARADDATWNGDANVLDDWHRRWPLLRQRWAGEPTVSLFPASPRLEFLRQGKPEEAREWMRAHWHS